MIRCFVLGLVALLYCFPSDALSSSIVNNFQDVFSAARYLGVYSIVQAESIKYIHYLVLANVIVVCFVIILRSSVNVQWGLFSLSAIAWVGFYLIDSGKTLAIQEQIQREFSRIATLNIKRNEQKNIYRSNDVDARIPFLNTVYARDCKEVPHDLVVFVPIEKDIALLYSEGAKWDLSIMSWGKFLGIGTHGGRPSFDFRAGGLFGVERSVYVGDDQDILVFLDRDGRFRSGHMYTVCWKNSAAVEFLRNKDVVQAAFDKVSGPNYYFNMFSAEVEELGYKVKYQACSLLPDKLLDLTSCLQ